MVNLRPVPQTWRAKRSEARRAQGAKKRRGAWAAGTAGAVGAYGIGMPGGDNGGGAIPGASPTVAAVEADSVAAVVEAAAAVLTRHRLTARRLGCTYPARPLARRSRP